LSSNTYITGIEVGVGSGWGATFRGFADNVQIAFGADEITANFERDLCSTTCYVDDSGDDNNDGLTAATALRTIQKAIDTVSAGGTVRVLPGSYDETATNRFVTGAGGPHQFGLHIGTDKNNITIMGVTAADAPITDPASVAAFITTNATNNFGLSGIFVDGDNVTLQGLGFGDNAPYNDKTIEVIGNNFTLRHSNFNVSDSGTLYISDFEPDANTLKSYRIENNRFDDGTQIAITSGAGDSGPVTSRVIMGNYFDITPQAIATYGNYPQISFNGAGGVAWFADDVGGAIIENNTFAPEEQYIRARGVYVEGEFDWESWWDNNTFEKAVVTLEDLGTFDVRETNESPFTNIRRINGLIQPDIDNIAQDGDTVLVAAGTYEENVTIDLPITLLSDAQGSVLAKDRPNAQSIIQKANGTQLVDIRADNVTIDGFYFNGAGNSNSWIITAVNPVGGAFDNIQILNNEFKGNGGNNVFPGGIYMWTANDALFEGNYFNDLGQHAVFMGNTSDGTIYRNNDSFSNFNSNFSMHIGPHTDVLIENNRAVQDSIILFKGSNVTIRDNQFTGDGTTSSRIYLGGGLSNVSIYENTFTNPRVQAIVVLDGGFGYGVNSAIRAYDNTINQDVSLMASTFAMIDYRDVKGENAIYDNEITLSGTTPGAVGQVDGIRLRGAIEVVDVYLNILNGGEVDNTPATRSTGIYLITTGQAAIPASASIDIYQNTISDFISGVGTDGPLAAGLDLSVNNNNLNGNTSFGAFNDFAGAELDATLNWWGSASGPSGEGPGTGDAVSANVEFCPWLDGPFNSGGVVFGPVKNTDTGEVFCSIQAAIDDIDTLDGHTIEVQPGTYTEQIFIYKDVRLESTGGAGVTTIAAPAGSVMVDNGPNPAGLNVRSIVTVREGADAELTGFTVDGPVESISGCGTLATGIYIHQLSALQINNVVVKDIFLSDTSLYGCQAGIGIRVGGYGDAGTPGTAALENVEVFEYQKGGIVVSGEGSSAQIVDSTFTGGGNEDRIAQNGIQVSYGATAIIVGANVSDHRCDNATCGADPLTSSFGAGVLIYDADEVEVRNSTIEDNDTGVYNYGDDTQIISNTLTGNRYYGVFLDEGSATLTSNTISGGNYGVLAIAYEGAVADSVGTLTLNTIQNALISGIHLLDSAAGSIKPVIDANRNAIINNEAGFNNTTSVQMDGECNWWGASNGPSGAGSGSGDSVSANVDFINWLTTSNLQNGPCDGGPRGTVNVTKQVVGPEAQSGSFTICLNNLANPLPEAERCQTTNVLGGGQQQTLTWQVPPGSYTVSEENPGAAWVVSYSPTNRTVNVTVGGTSSATVTNTYRQVACPATEFNEVVFYQPGLAKNGETVRAERQNTANAEGFAQNNDTLNFLSLGFGGVAIIEFTQDPVLNGTGPDVRIVETSYGDANRAFSQYPERVKVEASQDGVTYVEIGQTSDKDQSYDLGSLDWARYFRLTDISDVNSTRFPNTRDSDGFDIDAVEGLNCGEISSDVTVDKSAPTTATVGNQFDYTLTVRNLGQYSATNV
ncbi:MAG: right-handed parallel beta-helix repeat-containing protein, partial [bacterium]|nr:right-handed parallel beta-helix repeat-containing protein [bacterium]